jgi:hypothetical protein
MRALDAIQTMFTKLASPIAMRRRRHDFECGECERWERCGLPPSDDCIVKIEQIMRSDGRSIRRPTLPRWWLGSLG